LEILPPKVLKKGHKKQHEKVTKKIKPVKMEVVHTKTKKIIYSISTKIPKEPINSSPESKP